MAYSWEINEADIKYLNRFSEFIPDSLFDAHAHIYRMSDIKMSESSFLSGAGEKVDIQAWSKHMRESMGKVPEGGLFIPYPSPDCDIYAANTFLLSELDKIPGSRGLLLVTPTQDAEALLRQAENPNVAGFKTYHFYSTTKPTFDAKVEDYVPEWVFAEADKRSLTVLLHLVKDGALSDPDNQKAIISACEKYPSMKLVLAHAARGFNFNNTVKGLKTLRGFTNIYFDTSGVCEAESIKAILNEFGPSKLMWGSDFPISTIRGRCVTTGDSFVWLQDDTVDLKSLSTSYRPVMVGLESIAALKRAADDFGLNKEDIRNIFCGNIKKLLGITKEVQGKTEALYQHAKKVIPGGVQLLSKRPEMFAPDQWPAYFSEARGYEVIDLEGRRFYDMSTNGIGACLLGYRDEDVTRAVTRRINLGSMSSLNPPEEVYLADKLIQIHPWAKQVRFARTGGEIGAVAIRLARAAKDRPVVAISGYHGWHDWYLAANLGENDALRGHLLPGLQPLGVPGSLRNTTVPFKHGSYEEFDRVINTYGEKLAAVIMEPCRHHDPEKGFLEYVREKTAKLGIILIFDEITIGWRRNFGGSHLGLGIDPDMAIFAKSLGNGHPMAAVLGTDEAMSGAQSTFVSSTYWTESVGPAAALAVIEKMEKVNVPAHVETVGLTVIDIWKRHSEKHGIPAVFDGGYPCLAHFRFNHEKAQELNTLYVQLMLDKGFLAGVSIYPTLAHDKKVLKLYDSAVDEVFSTISSCIAENTIEKSLKGPVAHSGFRRLI